MVTRPIIEKPVVYIDDFKYYRMRPDDFENDDINV